MESHLVASREVHKARVISGKREDWCVEGRWSSDRWRGSLVAATSLPLVRLCPCWVTILGRARDESGTEIEEKVKRAMVSHGLSKLVRVDL